MKRQYVLSESEFAAYETLRQAAGMVISQSGNRSCRDEKQPSRHVNAGAFNNLLKAIEQVTAARAEAW